MNPYCSKCDCSRSAVYYIDGKGWCELHAYVTSPTKDWLKKKGEKVD